MNNNQTNSTFFQSAEQVIEKLSKTSALSPLLIMFVTFCFLIGMFVMFINSELILITLLIFLGVLSTAIIYAYFYFMHTNPQMLRSEKHVIQSQAISALGDERNKFNASAKDIVAVINESNPILQSDKISLPANNGLTNLKSNNE